MSKRPVIRIKSPSFGDYKEFLESEKKAWENTEIPPITFDQFASWIKVFPQGLIMAESEGKICGHIFSQRCDFRPYDPKDNRNWIEMTDRGCCLKTHDDEGPTLYVVSFSASVAGAGKLLLSQMKGLTARLGVKHTVGPIRLPGLAAFAEKMKKPIADAAQEYIRAVVETVRRERKENKVFDPTLTPAVSFKDFYPVRLIADYLPDKASGNYACLLVYDNPDF